MHMWLNGLPTLLMSEQRRMHVDVNLDRVQMGQCQQQQTLSLLTQAMVNPNTAISASIIHHRNDFSHKSFPCPCRSAHDTIPSRHANYQSPVNWSAIFSRKAVFSLPISTMFWDCCLFSTCLPNDTNAVDYAAATVEFKRMRDKSLAIDANRLRLSSDE